MWKRNRNHIDNEKLDRISEELLHALDATSHEIEAAANSPFLYRRIRSRIEAEEKRRAGERNLWFVLLTGIKNAIPVFTMIAIITIGIVMFNPLQNGTSGSNGASLIIINEELPALSSDEMIATFVGWNESQSDQLKEQQ